MEAIWSWFGDILEWLGFGGKRSNLMLLGLDNAGKTTLLYFLKTGLLKQTSPTFLPTNEEIEVHGIKFTCFDLGGHPGGRRIWQQYYPTVHGIVYMVDGADEERLKETKSILHNVLMLEESKNIPVVVLLNKMDARTALSEQQLREHLGLTTTTTTGLNTPSRELQELNIRPLEGEHFKKKKFMTKLICLVFSCSIYKKEGVTDGLRWLAKYL